MAARTHTDAAPERPAPTNVIQALARVMEELPGIGRNERSQQGYNYRGIEAITREASTLLGRYGVIFVPKVLERKTIDLTVNGKPWTEDHATIVYTVYGPGGIEDRIEVGPLIALGRDNSDKGMNKCMTQAFKYALLQTLCIGDSKDDADAHAAAEADHHPTTDPADWFAEHGWRGQLHHDEARSEIAAAVAALPEEAKPALKAWLKDQTSAPSWGEAWPEPYARAVSDRVKALSVPSAPSPDDEKAPSPPQTGKPTPQAGSPAPGQFGPCSWCEEPGTQLAPLIQYPDAGLMHAGCMPEWRADQPE